MIQFKVTFLKKQKRPSYQPSQNHLSLLFIVLCAYIKALIPTMALSFMFHRGKAKCLVQALSQRIHCGYLFSLKPKKKNNVNTFIQNNNTKGKKKTSLMLMLYTKTLCHLLVQSQHHFSAQLYIKIRITDISIRKENLVNSQIRRRQFAPSKKQSFVFVITLFVLEI